MTMSVCRANHVLVEVRVSESLDFSKPSLAWTLERCICRSLASCKMCYTSMSDKKLSISNTRGAQDNTFKVSCNCGYLSRYRRMRSHSSGRGPYAEVPRFNSAGGGKVIK